MLREFWDMNCCRTDVCLMRVRGGHCSQGSQAGRGEGYKDCYLCPAGGGSLFCLLSVILYLSIAVITTMTKSDVAGEEGCISAHSSTVHPEGTSGQKLGVGN